MKLRPPLSPPMGEETWKIGGVAPSMSPNGGGNLEDWCDGSIRNKAVLKSYGFVPLITRLGGAVTVLFIPQRGRLGGARILALNSGNDNGIKNVIYRAPPAQIINGFV